MPRAGNALTVGVAVALTVIAVITTFAYWPSLSVPFQFDDYARIVSNWRLQSGDWIKGIAHLGGVRILPSLTLLWNFRTSGDDTWNYHVLNLIVHLATTGMVFVMAWLLTGTRRLLATAVAAQPLFFASCAAALFACHPLQTQAVTYIIQRSSAMATLFYLLCVCAYIAGRIAQEKEATASATFPRRYFVLAILAAVAALLSKENAVTLPVAILLVEYAFFGPVRVANLLRAGIWLTPVIALPFVWKIVAYSRRRGQQASGTYTDMLREALFSPRHGGGAGHWADRLLANANDRHSTLHPSGTFPGRPQR